VTELPYNQILCGCPVCGSSFTRYPSQIERVKYVNVCSLKCLYEARSLGIIKREVVYPYKSSPKTRFIKNCLVCGGQFDTIPSRVKDGRGKYCSRKCFEKAHKLNMRGASNPSWIDGRSYNKRCFRGLDWNNIRKQVYQRDCFFCQVCGVKCVGRRGLTKKNSTRLIQCHHINGFNSVDDNILDKLITVCASCHKKIHEGGDLPELAD